MRKLRSSARNFFDFAKKNIFILFYIALFLVIQFNFNYRIYHEEFRDYAAYVAILEGKLPYVDFRWPYGPLGPFISACILNVFGRELIVLRITAIALRCIGILLAYAVSKHLLPKKAAALSAFLAIFCFFGLPSYTYNHYFGTLANLAITIFIFRFIESFKACYLFLGGLLLNISFFIMPLTFGLQMLLSLLIWLMLFAVMKKLNTGQFFKLALFFVIASSIFTIPVYSFILSRVPFGRVFDVLWSHRERFPGFPSFQIDFSNADRATDLLYKLRCIRYSIVKGLINPTTFYLLVFIVPLITTILASYWIRYKKDDRLSLKLSFLAILAFSNVVYFYYSDQRITEYYISYSMILLIFMLYSLFIYLRSKNLKSFHTLARLVCLFYFLAFLFSGHSSRLAHFLRKWSMVNVSPIKGIYLCEDEIKRYVRPSEYIKNNSDKDDALFVTFYDPSYYMLTCLRPIFPENVYIGTLPYSMIMDRSKYPRYNGHPMKLEDMTVARIKEERPKFIITDVRHIFEKCDYYQDIGPNAYGYIYTNYSLVKIFSYEEGEIRIYQIGDKA